MNDDAGNEERQMKLVGDILYSAQWMKMRIS